MPVRVPHAVKIAFRQFRRQRSTFLINILGLSTGLACAMLILLWVQDEYRMDAFHVLDDRLFQVMEFQEYSSGLSATYSTPGVLATALVDEIPEIEKAIGLDWGNKWTLTVGEKSLKQEGRHAGKDIFQMFTFPLLSGDPSTALAEPYNTVISRSTAVAFFGSVEEAIGRTIKFEHEHDLKVTGIMEDIGSNSTIRVDFFMSWEKFLDENDWARQWGNNGPHTYALLREGVDWEATSSKIADFVKGKDDDDSNVSLFLKRYSERYLFGRYENGKPAGGRIEYVRLFGLIAIFILVIASINFMNLSTAQASKRAKEIGVKKTLGITHQSLIRQFLTESVSISLISMVLAVVLAWLALPQFNLITGKEMAISADLSTIGGFFGLAITTGLLAGSYPALYLSRFKPVDVLKGTSMTSAGELWARKGLVIFQFAISSFLIAAVIVIYLQIKFVQNRDLGYEKDQLVMMDMNGTLLDQYDVFINRVTREPGVVSASTIGHSLIGRNNNTSGLSWEGKNPEELILFENVRVNYGAIETMGVEMAAGRSFSRDYGADSTKIILNEAATRVIGFSDPVGKVIRLWDEHDLEVIGVVKDFHFQSLHEPVKPLFFILRPDITWFMMVSLERGREQQGLKSLQNIFESMNPGFPFDYWWVDEEFAQQYAAEERVSSLSKYFAGIAVLISCLGLLGLAAFTAERRKKEIGVRKVLGASVGGIIGLLTKEFSRIVVVALLIGLPAAFVVLKNWLQRFEYRIELNAYSFVATGVLVLLIAYLTVSSQAYRAAVINPADSLQDE